MVAGARRLTERPTGSRSPTTTLGSDCRARRGAGPPTRLRAGPRNWLSRFWDRVVCGEASASAARREPRTPKIANRRLAGPRGGRRAGGPPRQIHVLTSRYHGRRPAASNPQGRSRAGGGCTRRPGRVADRHGISTLGWTVLASKDFEACQCRTLARIGQRR